MQKIVAEQICKHDSQTSNSWYPMDLWRFEIFLLCFYRVTLN